MSFADKVVIVTGSSAGIGAAAAVAFCSAGARVALVGRNQSNLAAVAARCAPHPHRPLVLNADVSDDDDAKRIVQTTIQHFGKIDVLVNNAGIVKSGSIVDGTIMDTFDELMSINFRAIVKLTTLAAPHLIATKGNIVNISGISATTFNLPVSIPIIGACKAALNYFTKYAALELAASGVRVNAVTPGPVRTEIIKASEYPGYWDMFTTRTALGRVSEPEEVVDLVLFLASEKAKGITGSNYVIDNGILLK
ncbi:unnamed protein product [Diatraea saccharalis]|uniref:3-oxoacyl-[acyl-carrier-protein] reductase FabG n=1 Tax=Diatraea saccharalis TaxID=40085 RepID=A0A9N9WGB0_9NEOP|nr:unnamed protein product [Diatraea saccharalis]